MSVPLLDVTKASTLPFLPFLPALRVRTPSFSVSGAFEAAAGSVGRSVLANGITSYAKEGSICRLQRLRRVRAHARTADKGREGEGKEGDTREMGSFVTTRTGIGAGTCDCFDKLHGRRRESRCGTFPVAPIDVAPSDGNQCSVFHSRRHRRLSEVPYSIWPTQTAECLS